MLDLSLQVKAKPASSGVSSGRRSVCQCLYPAGSKQGHPLIPVTAPGHRDITPAPPDTCCPSSFTWPWIKHPREEPTLGKCHHSETLPHLQPHRPTLKLGKAPCPGNPAGGKAESAAGRRKGPFSMLRLSMAL